MNVNLSVWHSNNFFMDDKIKKKWEKLDDLFKK